MAANYKKTNFRNFFYLFKKSRLYLVLRKIYIIKKKLIRTVSMAQIKRGLIFRFKKRGAVALATLQTKRFKFFKIKFKTFRSYVYSSNVSLRTCRENNISI